MFSEQQVRGSLAKVDSIFSQVNQKFVKVKKNKEYQALIRQKIDLEAQLKACDTKYQEASDPAEKQALADQQEKLKADLSDLEVRLKDLMSKVMNAPDEVQVNAAGQDSDTQLDTAVESLMADYSDMQKSQESLTEARRTLDQLDASMSKKREILIDSLWTEVGPSDGMKRVIVAEEVKRDTCYRQYLKAKYSCAHGHGEINALVAEQRQTILGAIEVLEGTVRASKELLKSDPENKDLAVKAYLARHLLYVQRNRLASFNRYQITPKAIILFVAQINEQNLFPHQSKSLQHAEESSSDDESSSVASGPTKGSSFISKALAAGASMLVPALGYLFSDLLWGAVDIDPVSANNFCPAETPPWNAAALSCPALTHEPSQSLGY